MESEDIPEELFERAWANQTPDSLESIENARFGSDYLPRWLLDDEDIQNSRSRGHQWDSSKFNTLIAKLLSFSLLQRKEYGKSCRIHPLVQLVTRERLSPDSGLQKLFLEQTIILLARAVPIVDTDAPMIQRKLFSHLESIYRHVVKLVPEPGEKSSHAVLWALNHIARLFWHQGRLAEAEKLYLLAKSGFTSLFGDNSESTLQVMNNLAGVKRERGSRRDSEDLYLQVLDKRKEILGLHNIDTLRTMNHLSVLYKDEGRLDEAEKLCRLSLRGKEEFWGSVHTETLWTAKNLAGLLRQKGEYHEAETLFRRSLLGMEKLVGPDHHDTLMIVDSTAKLYVDIGDYSQAQEMYQRSLAGREKLLGKHHPDTLWTVNSIGELCLSLGRLVEAEAYFKRALSGREKALGVRNPVTLWTVERLAKLYVEKESFDDAKRLYDRAFEVYSTISKTTNNQLRVMHSLGMLHMRMGSLESAHEYLENTVSKSRDARSTE